MDAWQSPLVSDDTWIRAGAIIWCIAIVGWAILRWIPNRRSRRVKINKTSRTPSERFSMAMSSAGLGIVPAIWVFGGWPASLNHATHPLVVLVGIVIFAFSLRLFRLTHKALGAMWSHSLDLREDHKLVTFGIYEHLRHPMYTAFWLWALAQPFLLSNWLAGFSGIVGFGTLYFLRVGQEEAMMEERFGQDYRDYSARTKRIVPGIY
jgi:protein-S-isoprenylcysteine O-methyltransferase Ste14